MPIRPIDTLTMPSRSQEASQVHQAENNKMTQAHERMGTQFNANVKHDSQQTVATNKSEKEEFRYKDGRRSPAEYSGNQQKKGKKKPEEKEKKEIKTSNFDLRI